MCMLYLFVNPKPKADEYLLVIANVRDEIFVRPTRGCHFWDRNPQIVGPMDLAEGRAGGTWMGMNVTGKFASLLNIIQPLDDVSGDKLPRGNLVVRYLENQQDGMTYLKDVRRKGDQFDRFLLVTVDVRPSAQDARASCYTNAQDAVPMQLTPGFHVFGNSDPRHPWRKVTETKHLFADTVLANAKVGHKRDLVKGLFGLMDSTTEHYPDEQLIRDAEGRSEESLRKLSSVFVRVDEECFGSRTHSIILVDARGGVDYVERTLQQPISLDSEVQPWVTTHLQFGIQDPGTLISRL
ncbi:transport and Golgi organization 2 homolog [Ornithodoros turicata]|uniref:transport and Golgi organization 2 homolog n=1 Tax=Ornithodoros turicata TaxID=34597 RepID=UPI00313993C6